MFLWKFFFNSAAAFEFFFIFEVSHFQEWALFTLFKGRLLSGGFFAVSVFRAPSLVSSAKIIEFWGKKKALLLNFIVLQPFSKRFFVLFYSSSRFWAPWLVSSARMIEFWGKKKALLLNFIVIQPFSKIFFVLFYSSSLFWAPSLVSRTKV